jgi:ABC-type transporter Mla subunit MlaD
MRYRFFTLFLLLLTAMAISIGGYRLYQKIAKELSHYRLVLALPKSRGVVEGDAVHILGVQVGYVREIAVTGSTVNVLLSIQKNIQIPEGSGARITTVSLLGKKSIELLPCSTGTFYTPGDTIREHQPAPFPSLKNVGTSIAQAIAGLGRSEHNDRNEEIMAKLDTIIMLLKNRDTR